MTERMGIVGLGVTGQAAVRYCLREGLRPVVVDTRPRPRSLPEFTGEVEYHFDAHAWPDVAVDRAVLSPGLKMDDCIVRSARDAGLETLVTVSQYTRDHVFDDALLVIDQLGEPDNPFQVISGDAGDFHYVTVDLLKNLHARHSLKDPERDCTTS